MNFSKSNHVVATQPRSSHCTTLDWNKLQSLPEHRYVFVSLDEIRHGSPQRRLFASHKGQLHHIAQLPATNAQGWSTWGIYGTGGALFGANLSLELWLGSCSRQSSRTLVTWTQGLAAASSPHMSSRWLRPETGTHSAAGEVKMWTCGAGTIADHSKSNPCAGLFQSPADNADVPIDSMLMSLFLLKAILIIRGLLMY